MIISKELAPRKVTKCCKFSPNGQFLGVTLYEGGFVIYDTTNLKEALCKIYTPAIESSFELVFEQETEDKISVYVGDSDSIIRHFGIKTNEHTPATLHEYESS